MIYVACGCLIMFIGLLWLIFPAKKPSRVYGYLSYLAQVNDASFKFAQKRASLYCLLYGGIQVVLGLIIKWLNLDRFFVLWLLTFYLFIIFPIVSTEKSLESFLKKRHELPADYQEPDKVKRSRTKGFKD